MKIISLLLCVALLQIVSATVISLEEGDTDTKRIFKWILDPMSPNFPLPRFPYQNGKDAEFKEFRFLGTLDCSALATGEVGMAIYDPDVDDWNCTSTGNLPNDTSVPSDVITGIPYNCTGNFVAVWNHSISEWTCSTREALLYQSQGLIQDLCRSGDLLTINYDESDIYINRPAGLCVAPGDREVGPNAVVKLKRNPRNVGDPDEAFYVQTTSKAIGGLGATGGSEHFNWQYWAWSPVKTSFASSIGAIAPILAFDGMHLAAVTAQTYTWSSNVYTVANIALTFKVVRVSVSITGSPPTAMFYLVTDHTETITAPARVIYTDAQTVIPDLAIPRGNALSIRILTIPGGLTGTPRSAWLAVSLWVSHILLEQ